MYNVELSKIKLSSINHDEFNDKMKNNKIIFAQLYNDLRVLGAKLSVICSQDLIAIMSFVSSLAHTIIHIPADAL